MSISDGLDPYFFRRKIEKTQSMKEKKDGKMFISHQVQHFSSIDYMIKALFPIRSLIWRVNNYVTGQTKGINSRNESTNSIIKFCSLWYCINSPENVNCLL